MIGCAKIITISIAKNNTELSVLLSGRLDTTTAPELEAKLRYVIDGANETVKDIFGITGFSDILTII